MISGRILVSMTRLKAAQRMTTPMIRAPMAGSKRRALRIQNDLRSIVPEAENSRRSSFVMMYPEMTKNMVTPSSPPDIQGAPRW